MSTNLSVTIIRNRVWEQLHLLASYEARDRHAEDGSSLYEQLIMTTQDEPLINSYISTSISDLRHAVHDMIESVTEVNTNTIIVFCTARRRTDTRDSAVITTHIHEYVTSSVMAAWLLYRGISDRTEFYTSLSGGELQFIRNRLYTKGTPIFSQP